MSPDLGPMFGYPLIAVVAGVVAFAGGVVAAVKAADDTADLVLLSVIALMAAVVAGAIWPGALLIVVVVGSIKGAQRWGKARTERRAQRVYAEHHKPSDAARYRLMAKSQHDLAVQARADGVPELAEVQESLAAQYEQIASLYQKDGR